MFDADREHQRATTTVLCHLARTITITLHEGHQTRRRQRRVVHGLSLRTDMTQVVTYATASLHQLHLLLVDAHHRTIRVGITIQSDDEAVRQRGYLVVVADTCHRTSGRHDIAEVIQQIENLLGRHRVLVLLFYTGYLVGQSPVHLFGRLLIDLSKRVFHRILVHPYASGKLIAAKISK